MFSLFLTNLIDNIINGAEEDLQQRMRMRYRPAGHRQVRRRIGWRAAGGSSGVGLAERGSRRRDEHGIRAQWRGAYRYGAKGGPETACFHHRHRISVR